MFLEFVRFELFYRLRRPATFIYFLVFFLISFGVVSADMSDPEFIGAASGTVFTNAPYLITYLITALSILAIFVASAIMGVPVYRELEHKTASFFFTLPFNYKAYLAGRFVGSFLVLLGIMFFAVAGILLGTQMPWLAAEKTGPTLWQAYINSCVFILLPNLLLMSGVFFALVALSGRVVAAYAGSVLLFVCYLISSILMKDINNQALAALIDPFGLAAVKNITRYWTVAEKNALPLPLTQELLLNRLLYGGIGLLMLFITLLRFDFRRFAGFTRAGSALSHKQPAAPLQISSQEEVALPLTSQRFGTGFQIMQMLQLGRLQLMNIAKNPLFLVMLLAVLIFLFFNGWKAGDFFGASTYPLTYNMVMTQGPMFSLLMLVFLVFFSGELVWQERSLGFSGIMDTYPVRNWVNMGAKFIALAGICVALCSLVIIAGIGVQALQGYYKFEPGLYITEIYIHTLPKYLVFATLCLFFHSLINNKFMGFFCLMVFFVGLIALRLNVAVYPLFLFNTVPTYTYSDMNGYGHFMQGWTWFTLYWLAFAMVLLVLINVLWLRGTETGWRNRLRIMGQRLRTAKIHLGAALLLCMAFGGWIFYNTNVLNTSQSPEEQVVLMAAYEKSYKQYQDRPQPKITAISLQVELYPAGIAAEIRGTYTLENKTKAAIDTLFVQFNDVFQLQELQLDGAYQKAPVNLENKHHFYIISLAKPLQPGEKARLNFSQTYRRNGFSLREQHMMVKNGTFLSSGLLPGIGYDAKGGELSHPERRREHGLGERPQVPDLDDAAASQYNFLTPDAGWIDFEATIGTAGDQIAIAPGYLERKWSESGRNYFHYKMDTPILRGIALLSARYNVLRDEWKPAGGGRPVAIEIFYHPGHEYNLGSMMASVKASLQYYTTHFGHYQHRQLRILEFPRYETFARSLPNTIPYSEGVGFVTKVEEDNPQDINHAFSVTAHEVAHQWWGHQLTPAAVQGAAMLNETFSQYASLMVIKHVYGEEKVRHHLRQLLEGYLIGRSHESGEELPLYRVEQQKYVYTGKGSVVMYALQDYLGEAAVNRTLRRLIDSAAFTQPPYPTTRTFLEILRQETPDSLQYLVEDLFEKVTCYNNRLRAASARQVNKQWEVSFTIEAEKQYAGAGGKPTAAPLQDWVDIGVFTEQQLNGKTSSKPLYLEKHQLKSGVQTITIRVKEKPLNGGVDPYHKLIDRNLEDNMLEIDIEE